MTSVSPSSCSVVRGDACRRVAGTADAVRLPHSLSPRLGQVVTCPVSSPLMLA